jgi:hypothetical protein
MVASWRADYKDLRCTERHLEMPGIEKSNVNVRRRTACCTAPSAESGMPCFRVSLSFPKVEKTKQAPLTLGKTLWDGASTLGAISRSWPRSGQEQSFGAEMQMIGRAAQHVLGRESNVIRVDFSRRPDPPPPNFPGAGALRGGIECTEPIFCISGAKLSR